MKKHFTRNANACASHMLHKSVETNFVPAKKKVFKNTQQNKQTHKQTNKHKHTHITQRKNRKSFFFLININITRAVQHVAARAERRLRRESNSSHSAQCCCCCCCCCSTRRRRLHSLIEAAAAAAVVAAVACATLA